MTARAVAQDRSSLRRIHRRRSRCVGGTLFGRGLIGTSLTIGVMTTVAVAVELDEDRYGDAGSLPPSALPAVGNGPLERIKGRLSSARALAGVDDFEDMYLIRIVDVDAFSARTVDRDDGDPTFDTQLWLFSACGFGQVGNDDDVDAPAGTGYSILLPNATDGSGFSLPGPGLYYLAVSGKGRIPLSPAGAIFDLVDPFEISGPDGPGGGQAISAWTGIGEVGAYQIELTGCAFLGAGFGDLNGDGAVDGADLGYLLNAWGTDDPVADLDGNGSVDGADLGLLLNEWGPALGPHYCGDEGAGDCFVANGTPYCDDICCCTLVCDADPFCCETAWDGLCVSGARSLCGAGACELECPRDAILEGEPCGAELNDGCEADGAAANQCCSAWKFPGCGDPACEAQICGFDPFCCQVMWDEICANFAQELCAVCEQTVPPVTPISCGATVCGTTFAAGFAFDRDWYAIQVDEPIEATITFTAQRGMQVGIYANEGRGACIVGGTLFPVVETAACETASFTACLSPGVWWLRVAPTTSSGTPCGAENDYIFTVQCASITCVDVGCGAPAAGSCFVPGFTPFCSIAFCCEAVCAQDPFCCEVAWDKLCVDIAYSVCDVP